MISGVARRKLHSSEDVILGRLDVPELDNRFAKTWLFRLPETMTQFQRCLHTRNRGKLIKRIIFSPFDFGFSFFLFFFCFYRRRIAPNGPLQPFSVFYRARSINLGRGGQRGKLVVSFCFPASRGANNQTNCGQDGGGERQFGLKLCTSSRRL